MALTNKQKALIHVAKAQTGMSDETYKDLLACFGVESARDLTPELFDEVMEHFRSIGFRSSRGYHKPPKIKRPLLSKVFALMHDLDLSEAYIDGMTKRMFRNQDGEPIVSFRWLSSEQLHKLVAALTYRQRLIAKKRAEEGVHGGHVDPNRRRN